MSPGAVLSLGLCGGFIALLIAFGVEHHTAGEYRRKLYRRMRDRALRDAYHLE